MHRRIRFFQFAIFTAAVPALFGQAVTNTSATNYRLIVAPDSIVSSWGSNLARNTVSANTATPPVTLPTNLGGVELTVTGRGSDPVQPGLYMVSPGQINFVLPDRTEPGRSGLNIRNSGVLQQGPLLVSNVSPGIFTADGSGSGVPAAQVLRVAEGGQATYESPIQSGSSTYVPRPINLRSAAGDKVYILLYGTGIRKHSLNPVIATVQGEAVPVTYAGAQSEYPGLDQVNIGPIPAVLAGSGVTELVVIADGVPSNAVQLSFQ